MTKVLVTGGFGFVGGRLASHLENKGLEVFRGSRSTGNTTQECERSRRVVTKWSSTESLVEACRGIDIIVHCAGLDAQSCSVDPKQAFEVNARNTEQLGLAAEASGVRSLFFISTAHVYRSPLVGYLDESSPTTNRHPYAESHLEGERALLRIDSRAQLNVSNLRLANAFGLPATQLSECWKLVVNDLCWQANSTGRIVLRSTSNEWRNFIGLNAVAEAVASLMRLNEVPKTLNLGQRDLPLLDLADLISQRFLRIHGYSPKIEFDFAQSNEENLKLTYSSQLAARLLGSLPEIESEIDNILQHSSGSPESPHPFLITESSPQRQHWRAQKSAD